MELEAALDELLSILFIVTVVVMLSTKTIEVI